MFKWKIVPLCEMQLKDVDPKDILHNGHFRKCNVYKSGGGYDKFPDIAEKRLGKRISDQFVIQLYGCTLSCPYCYVTKEGIFGKYIEYSSNELINICKQENLEIFHLMGGSPAIYLDKWHEIIDCLDKNIVFHSDLLLIERLYKNEWLKNIKVDNSLYAINIKGVTPWDFYENTNTRLNEELFWYNFDRVIESDINFYLTFTNPNKNYLDEFKYLLIKRYGEKVLDDSFVIDLIEYEALK